MNFATCYEVNVVTNWPKDGHQSLSFSCQDLITNSLGIVDGGLNASECGRGAR